MSWIWPPEAPVGVIINASDDRYPVNRIFCIGRNYSDHAKEMGAKVDRDEPFFFTKSPAHLIASPCEINYPLGTENLHHEIELVVALGNPSYGATHNNGQQIPSIFGYACGVDLTRRDLQAKAKADRKPWDNAKDFENGAVISPIMPVSEIGIVASGRIELRVNDEQKQDADLCQMVWSVIEIIHHLSNYYELRRGDLIYTGTPAGVGPLAPGDQLLGSITSIGEVSLQIAT